MQTAHYFFKWVLKFGGMGSFQNTHTLQREREQKITNKQLWGLSEKLLKHTGYNVSDGSQELLPKKSLTVPKVYGVIR